MTSMLVALLLSQQGVRLINAGSNVGQVTSINCTGSGVVCSRSGTAGTMAITAGAGSGTVTSVSVVTANGVSGSVANPTTTPAITLSLGAIAPTAVAASGTITGSNLSGTSSGTNTGDQTITLTGNVTGSGTGSFATTITPASVTPAMLSATGTAGIDTFLRGDGSWAPIPQATAPAFVRGPPLPVVPLPFAVPARFQPPCNAVRRRLCKEAPQGVHQ